MTLLVCLVVYLLIGVLVTAWAFLTIPGGLRQCLAENGWPLLIFKVALAVVFWLVFLVNLAVVALVESLPD